MALKTLKGTDSAEKLHTKALPQTAHAAFKRELSASLASHLEKTVDDIERLDRLVETCGNKLKRMKRDALNGPRSEDTDLTAEDLISEDATSPPRVSPPVGAAHKARHYETATYGTLAAFASHLDHPEAVELLKKTLEEEKASGNSSREADPTPGEAAASDEPGEPGSAPAAGNVNTL